MMYFPFIDLYPEQHLLRSLSFLPLVKMNEAQGCHYAYVTLHGKTEKKVMAQARMR